MRTVTATFVFGMGVAALGVACSSVMGDDALSVGSASTAADGGTGATGDAQAPTGPTPARCTELKCTVVDYDINITECHWHAIQCRNENPDKPVGYCACYSELGRDGQAKPAEGHYYNWYVNSSGKTCIVNYGNECCWDGGTPAANPPDVSKGEGAKCAQWACGGKRGDGGQYGDTTKCFKLGTGQPHAPRADECRTKTKTKESCERCCDTQADYWNAAWIDTLQKQIDKLNTQIAGEKDPTKKAALEANRDALQKKLDKRKDNREDFRKACKDICGAVAPTGPIAPSGPTGATGATGGMPGDVPQSLLDEAKRVAGEAAALDDADEPSQSVPLQ